MRTDYLCGLLWVGGGRESQESKQCETEKQRQKKNHFWFRKMPSFVRHVVPWKTSPPSLQHTMARLCEETVQPHKAESAHLTVHPCQHSFLHTLHSPCASSGKLWTPLQANSAAHMWQNTNFCFIPTSMQFSAKLLSLSSSEITLRIAKAGTRRWLKHSTGRKKVEGESFLYLHFLEQIIKLPPILWEL